jgi:hypothetical protein
MNKPKDQVPCQVCDTTGVSKFSGRPCLCCHEKGYITPERAATLARIGRDLTAKMLNVQGTETGRILAMTDEELMA